MWLSIYLALFPPSWAKWEQLKLILTSFLGKRNCILSFTLLWEGQPRRRPQFKFGSTHASFGCFHCYFLWDERLYMTPASAPEKSMLQPSVIRTLTLKAPRFFSAQFPIAHASLKFSSLSSQNCLCSNCVLFLPPSSCCPSRRRTVPRSQSVMILTLILAWR